MIKLQDAQNLSLRIEFKSKILMYPFPGFGSEDAIIPKLSIGPLGMEITFNIKLKIALIS